METNSNKIKLDLYRAIDQETKGLSILTGSLALIIQNEIKERECHDIDIINIFKSV